MFRLQLDAQKFPVLFIAVVLSIPLLDSDSSQAIADPVGWGVGQITPDFAANYLAGGDANQTTSTTWYDERGTADVYVISSCAIWCPPCRNFALDSGDIVSHMAAEGFDVNVYDWIYQDNLFQDPDENDVAAWVQGLWTAAPENAWFGGDIFFDSSAAEPGVIGEIYDEYNSSSPGRILVLDRNFVVRDSFIGSGFSSGLATSQFELQLRFQNHQQQDFCRFS
ncbi:MAG: hypothetical protein AAF456_12070 [Planctomycetota bacterium]